MSCDGGGADVPSVSRLSAIRAFRAAVPRPSIAGPSQLAKHTPKTGVLESQTNGEDLAVHLLCEFHHLCLGDRVLLIAV